MIGMNAYIKLILLVILVAAFIVTGYLDHATRPDWKKISPFTAVTLKAEKIIAEFEGGTYEVLSIEGISTAELIRASKRRFGRKWQKRIREDLPEVLEAAGAPSSNRVDLELKDTISGTVKQYIDAEMTEANRRVIYSTPGT